MAKLVAGPGVYICNECIDLCTQIVAMETMPVVGASHERPDDELLTSLARVQKVAPRMDSAIVTQITPMSTSGDLGCLSLKGDVRRVRAQEARMFSIITRSAFTRLNRSPYFSVCHNIRFIGPSLDIDFMYS